MLASIADSESLVQEPLTGEDCVSTLCCLEALGLRYSRTETTALRLQPPREFLQPGAPLDCGNSGTTMRLLSGLIASRPIEATLIGDASLSKRPMKRIAEPLRLMGAELRGDTPPLWIRGSDNLKGINYATPVSSAQIKSAVLLAGLRATGETWVREPAKSRDHTERMLAALGVEVKRKGDTRVGVSGGARFEGFQFSVPGDISSAAFWMAAAAIVPGSFVALRNVGVNPSRTGVLDVFRQAGIEVLKEGLEDELGEPVAVLGVGSAVGGKAFGVSGALVPRLIDEIPVLAVLATQLDGVSTIRDARELRVKESDRIAKVAEGLRAMGAYVETYEDGLDVEGPTNLRGAIIDAEGDHRIAMAFAVAGLIAEGETTIEGAESIATSYPSFLDDLRSLQQG